MLYPKMTSSRMVFDLSGVLWEFKLLDEEGTEGSSGKQDAGQYTDAKFRLHITIYIQRF